VERVLDAALALEQCIDSRQPLNRPPYPQQVTEQRNRDVGEFRSRYEHLPGSATMPDDAQADELPAPLPPHPESDLLWFIARYAPNMQDWERDIFLAVREESWYFQPVFNCQIMNEGWACHWHARLLREAKFLTPEMYVDAMKTHSDVVRPYAGGQQVALSINPYHLGYQMWDRIVTERGVEEARRIMREEDDFGFVRNYLDEELARELDLFVYEEKSNGEVKATSWDLDALHESILGPKYNFGAPQVAVDALGADGTLTLRHDHSADGRGLDVTRAQHVLRYIDQVWRGPVELNTVDVDGNEVRLSANAVP
jgi:stage V sporulation protein R